MNVLSAYMCATCMPGAYVGQKVLDSLKLKLYIVVNHAVGSENQILKKNDSCSITESSFQPQYLTILALDITDVCSLYIMTGLIRIFVFNCIMGFHLGLVSSHTVFIRLSYFHIICTMCVCARARTHVYVCV